MATSWKGAPKDPEDIRDYGIDWTADLGTATITEAVFSVKDGDVQITATDYTDTTATVRIAGGTVAASPAVINCLVTLSTGEQMDVDNKLVIKERVTG